MGIPLNSQYPSCLRNLPKILGNPKGFPVAFDQSDGNSDGATCAPGIVRCCPENRISLRILCISWYHARSFLSSAAQNVRTCNETEGREKWFSSSKKNVFVRFKEKTLAILTGLYYNTPTNAGMMELVDVVDSKSDSSAPAFGLANP